MQSFIRTLTGYAQNAHKAGGMNLRRSRLTLSGLIIENRAVHRFALLRMFGPSPQATLVKHLETTMASADFCHLTRCITARRAARADGSLPVRSRSDRAARSRAWSFRVRHHHAVISSTSRRQGGQISPGKNVNCRCTSAAFTVGCVPVGFAVMCHRQQHPSALTMRFLSVASHLLHSGFLQTMPRDIALAVGSWLSLLTMSPSRYSHRGLAPHKFAPMLGAHPSIERTRHGSPLQALISFWALRAMPARAAHVKR